MAEAPQDSPPPSLLDWIRRVYAPRVPSLVRIAGDASTRSYYRLGGDARGLVVMHAPGQRQGVERFLAVGATLARAGIRVPEVVAADPERGYVLMDDLGTVHYLDVLDGRNADRLYGHALDALLRIQREVAATDLPPYDEALLRRELAIFREWYLGVHVGRELAGGEAAAWERGCDLLVANALEQPITAVHRDYHSRNLMVLGDGEPGVLDFQDAVAGPATYDLASLLLDCYVAWPRERVNAWALAYRHRLVAAGLIPPVGDAPFLRRLHLTATQRHLKAIGIFARLWHRDGKGGYLGDIPRTARYVRMAAAAYPELAPLAELVVDAATADGDTA